MICNKCPRLCAFIEKNKQQYPDFFNAPVPNFGDSAGIMLIVGLAPGLKGANRTGRPFTGDYAGVSLYETMKRFGWTKGEYKADPKDGFELKNVLITNAVGCVPPGNKPTPAEIKNCSGRLKQTIDSMKNLRILFCLGRISHDAVLSVLNQPKSKYPFAHGAVHELPSGVRLIDCYHCSRYNMNTGRLTQAMLDSVFEKVNALR